MHWKQWDNFRAFCLNSLVYCIDLYFYAYVKKNAVSFVHEIINFDGFIRNRFDSTLRCGDGNNNNVYKNKRSSIIWSVCVCFHCVLVYLFFATTEFSIPTHFYTFHPMHIGWGLPIRLLRSFLIDCIFIHIIYATNIWFQFIVFPHWIVSAREMFIQIKFLL